MPRTTNKQRGLALIGIAVVGLVVLLTTAHEITRFHILGVLAFMVVAIFGLLVMRGGIARAVPFRDVIERSLYAPTTDGANIGFTLAASLIGLFFLSGFSALLYQVVWQRLLGLFAGSDVRSITLVTGAYLGGLGVGGLIGSQVADRLDSKQAVRLYAVFNLGIAAFAFLSKVIFYDLLFLGLGRFSDSSVLMFIVVFASLLIPTTLMGLSLPLLSRALVRNVSGAAGIIALLNGINIFGAAIGALFGGLVLVGSLGFDRAVYIGGGISAIVGLLGLRLSMHFPRGDNATFEGQSQRGPEPLRDIPRVVWAWCALVFISGFLSISLELIWFRILDVSLHSNAYTFAYLLFIFLVGDGFGNVIGARMVRNIPNPRRIFLWIQSVIALYTLASVALLLTAAQFGPLFAYFNRSINEGTFLTFAGGVSDSLTTLTYLGFPALLMAVPTVLIGLTFPFMQRAVQTDMNVVGQRVSLLDVANILGNTAASLITGLVFLNFLYVDGALRIIGVIGLIFLAVVVLEGVKEMPARQRISAAVVGVALVALIIALPHGTDFWKYLHWQARDNQLYVAEDSSGVTAIIGDKKQIEVIVNGRPQGQIPFSGAHVTMGIYPAMIHPAPRRILIIGLATGGTAYTSGIRPVTKDITVVEIIGSDVDVLKAFTGANHNPAIDSLFSDPRYTLVVGDGRHYLLNQGQPYDIIQADPVQPVSSGSGFLYSHEYFQQARARLAKGGIMAEWRPTDRVEATFKEVFPHGFVVGGLLLIGSNDPISFDRNAISARFDDPEVEKYCEKADIDFEAFRKILLSQPIDTWDAPIPATDVNTDLWPRDEYFLNNPYEGPTAK